MGICISEDNKRKVTVLNYSNEKIYYECYVYHREVVFPQTQVTCVKILGEGKQDTRYYDGNLETIRNIKINVFDKDSGEEIIKVDGLVIKITHDRELNTTVSVFNI